jgi:hypothetical protein
MSARHGRRVVRFHRDHDSLLDYLLDRLCRVPVLFLRLDPAQPVSV